MASEIGINDLMFSVKEVPWHGLGNVIENHPTIEEAIVASGLDWSVSLENMKVPMDIDGNGTMVDIEVPNQKAIVRNDIHAVLGVVGSRYTLYQNSEMWDFISAFQAKSGILLETAGSLKNGRTTWVLGKNVSQVSEYIAGDPIEEYFLFKNSFDGSSPVSILNTNIRVVCNNTLTAAIRKTKNSFNVKHTASMSGQIDQAEKALGMRAKYQEIFGLLMTELVKTPMTSTRMTNFLENTLFPMPTQTNQIVSLNDTVGTLAEVKSRGLTMRQNKIDAITNLIDTGAGTDIPGVKGTAYGLYNAITEWADHDKQVRVVGDGDERETKFVNTFYGTGATFKADALNLLIKEAA